MCTFIGKRMHQKAWKFGTLKGLFRRALLISSEEKSLWEEIKYLKNVFIKVNNYPKSAFNKTLTFVKQKLREEGERLQFGVEGNSPNGTVITVAEVPIIHPHIILPYQGFQGDALLKGFRKVLRECLPQNVVPRLIYKGKKLGSFFTIKDKIDSKHISGIVYGFNVPHMEVNVIHYVGEINVRNETRM